MVAAAATASAKWTEDSESWGGDQRPDFPCIRMVVGAEKMGCRRVPEKQELCWARSYISVTVTIGTCGLLGSLLGVGTVLDGPTTLLVTRLESGRKHDVNLTSGITVQFVH